MTRKSDRTREEIVSALKQAMAGMSVAEICRKYRISHATFYRWRAKYGESGPEEVDRHNGVARAKTLQRVRR